MGVLDWFIAPKPKTANPANLLAKALFRYHNGGMPVQQIFDSPESTARFGYANNPDVYSVVNLVVKACLTVPETLYIATKDTANAKAKQALCAARGIHAPLTVFTKDLKEVTDGKLYNLLSSPNPTQSGSELKEFTLFFHAITGNAYEYGIGPDTGPNVGLQTEIHGVYPQMVELITAPDALGMVDGYKLLHTEVTAKAWEIMHFKTFNPLFDTNLSHLYGLSPLYAARNVVELGTAAYMSLWQVLHNGGLKGVFTLDGKDSSEAGSYTPQQAREFNSTLNQKMKSKDDIAVFLNEALRWQPLGISPVDMNLLEGLQFTKRGICDIYSVNSALLNDPENKTYNNMAEARKALYTNAVMPRLKAYESARGRWLISRYSKADNKQYVFGHDYSVIPELQEDTSKLYDTLEKVSFLTPDEKRSLMNWAEMGTDATRQLYVPGTHVPIDQLDTAIDAAEKQLALAGIDDYE